MSADNWDICPRCVDRALAERARLAAEASYAYGHAAPEEYDRLRLAAAELVDPEKFRTFREDYEFYGVERGVVTASYSGRCSVCHLSLEFQDEHPFYVRTAVAS